MSALPIAAAAPESLQLRGFHDIAGVPWQLLSGADWPQLKKADFSRHLGQHTSELFSFGFLRDPPPLLLSSANGPRCFENNGEGREGLLGALARCRELEEQR